MDFLIKHHRDDGSNWYIEEMGNWDIDISERPPDMLEKIYLVDDTIQDYPDMVLNADLAARFSVSEVQEVAAKFRRRYDLTTEVTVVDRDSSIAILDDVVDDYNARVLVEYQIKCNDHVKHF